MKCKLYGLYKEKIYGHYVLDDGFHLQLLSSMKKDDIHVKNKNDLYESLKLYTIECKTDEKFYLNYSIDVDTKIEFGDKIIYEGKEYIVKEVIYNADNGEYEITINKYELKINKQDEDKAIEILKEALEYEDKKLKEEIKNKKLDNIVEKKGLLISLKKLINKWCK